MKPVLLTVEGEEFIIDTNESGEPQIRKRSAAVIERDRYAVARGKSRYSSETMAITLKVEAMP